MKKLIALAAAVGSAAFVIGPARAANRIIDISDSEKVQVFDEPGSYNWLAPNNLVGTVQLLVVGGGGAGGGNNGGGGGGGQVVYNQSVELVNGGSYTCVVGAGGELASGRGQNGGDSSFSGGVLDSVVAVGGGGGGGNWTAATGGAGGNGGGAGGQVDGVSGGQATVDGGFPGGNTVKNNNNFAAGGGGGAGGPGVNGAIGPDKGGDGGPGVNCKITGEDIMYGAGGGGTVFYLNATNYGCGGAGDGYGDSYRSDAITGQPGHDGVGSGGGGGKANGGELETGGRGGNGTVIIRYTIDTAKDDFSADIVRSIKVPTMVTFTAELGTELSEMTWDFGDGSDPVVMTDLSVSHEYGAAGKYTVTMTHGPQTIIKENYIEIVSGTLYVDDDSENPQPPYDSPAKAAKNIDEALAIAENGFMICVAPGDYPVANAGGTVLKTLQFTNAVTMIGTGASPHDVVIRNSQTRRGYAKDQVLYVNNADALVANVTIADAYIGNAGWGASVYVDTHGGTVSNCVIRNGLANIPVQAKCAGVFMRAGLLTHSVISNCSFMAQTGDLNNIELASALLIGGSGRAENCLIQDCGVGVGAVVSLQNSEAELVNSTIAGGTVGFWTGNNRAITNKSYAVGCQNGTVKNVAVYNVKRVAYNDNPETYDCAFGPDLSKFTCCVKAEKGDFADYDNGKLSPSFSGALFNAGDDAAVNEGSDLAGNPRIVGAHVDIGCYEAGKSVGLLIFLR